MRDDARPDDDGTHESGPGAGDGTAALPRPLRDTTAAALVFGSSCAVLVVELVALRLLAPYLGLTLETNTLVIGLALTAIAVGSWAGGQVADQIDPRRALGPLLSISGVVIAFTPWAVRGVAEQDTGGLLYLVSAAAIIVPGTLLSAVTPMVTKLMLRDLGETGTIVGRLSGIGTVGAIVGTVLTGFVLITHVRVSVILVGLGVLLVVAGALLEIRIRGWLFGALTLALVAAGGVTAALAPGGCDVETTYHCASVEHDEDGGLLILDSLRHSYVSPENPEYLHFMYTRAYAAVIAAEFEEGEPIRSHHLGAGGVTMPRYLEAVRPGSRSTVAEIDGGVVQLDRDELGLVTDADLQVEVIDGRLSLRQLEQDSQDLVIGDAFGGISVPWHLTTRETMADIGAALTDEGVYAANIIDHGELAFARAAVRTMQEEWAHVAALAWGPALEDGRGGNIVVVGSDEPLPVDDYREQLQARGLAWEPIAGDDLEEFVGDAPVLTDDYAPVDQLLTPYATAAG